GADRLVAAHEQRDDHVREHDHVAQRQDRKIAGGGLGGAHRDSWDGGRPGAAWAPLWGSPALLASATQPSAAARPARPASSPDKPLPAPAGARRRQSPEAALAGAAGADS